mmetsp:Transcript_3519/g.12408  ORF Transcript_3519/g.12408 Transcript_3519/m.12408 type:complete len:302 (-) Transcript_3519:131-1036(-)
MLLEGRTCSPSLRVWALVFSVFCGLRQLASCGRLFLSSSSGSLRHAALRWSPDMESAELHACVGQQGPVDAQCAHALVLCVELSAVRLEACLLHVYVCLEPLEQLEARGPHAVQVEAQSKRSVGAGVVHGLVAEGHHLLPELCLCLPGDHLVEHLVGLLVLEAKEAVSERALLLVRPDHRLQAEDMVLLQLALCILLELHEAVWPWPRIYGPVFEEILRKKLCHAVGELPQPCLLEESPAAVRIEPLVVVPELSVVHSVECLQVLGQRELDPGLCLGKLVLAAASRQHSQSDRRLLARVHS